MRSRRGGGLTGGHRRRGEDDPRGVGEDPARDGLQRTPERVADMYAEIFAGIGADGSDELDVVFEAGHDEMIMVRDIPLASVCEHHLIPFIGKAHVAYIPNESGQITGLSKLARLVDVLSRQPQVGGSHSDRRRRENDLSPRGVWVVLEAEQICRAWRCAQAGSKTVNSRSRHLGQRPTRPGDGPIHRS